jgi:bifunctional non-homologous end joining protein LigD
MSDFLSQLSKDELAVSRETSMPEWQEPMLAKLAHDYFSDPGWIFERKLDGERVITYIRPSGNVHLMSRNQKRLNDHYPEIETALAENAPPGCILDGEVVAFDQNHVSDFQRLQPRMQASSRDEARASDIRIYYYIFDCLYLEGHDITECGLRSRKKLLKAAVNWQDPLRWTPHRNEDGLDYYREACEKGWEGLIAKDASAPYVNGRSARWLKFKCVMRQEFVIGGYTEPQGGRIGFGALLLGFYRQGRLIYAGKVGTGFDDDTLKYLHRRLTDLDRESSPFDHGDPKPRGVHFVTPNLVCEVGFTEWTDGEKLRHPRYKGLRRDKNPEDVHREVESQTADL